MSIVKGFGSSTLKVGNALEALGRTDDMLAVIGVIMLLGVFFSSFGSYWQGVLARDEYYKVCEKTGNCDDVGIKSFKYYLILIVSGIIILGLIRYIYRRKLSSGSSTTAATA
jgi:hypothetical protein